MNSKLLAALLISLVSLPAFAQHRGHGHGHHHGGHWVGPLIGGMIIGGVLNEMSRPTPPVVVHQPPAIPPYYYRQCRQVLAVQIDRYGNEYRYPVTVCD